MAVLLLVVNVSFVDPAFARSSGRMGGSFKSSRAHTVKPLSTMSAQSLHRPHPRITVHRTSHVNYPPSHRHVPRSQAMTFSSQVPRSTKSEVLWVTTVSTMVTIKVVDKIRNKTQGNGFHNPLGCGVSVLSLTTAVNVPDRDSPYSILAQLDRVARTARTNTRKGVQDLVSETALILLRHEDSILAVDSYASHFRGTTQAQRDFNVRSIEARSKFDDESCK